MHRALLVSGLTLTALLGCYGTPHRAYPSDAGEVGDVGDANEARAQDGPSQETSDAFAPDLVDREDAGQADTPSDSTTADAPSDSTTDVGAADAPGSDGAPACTPACDVNHVCSAGRCLLVEGQACTLASQCASNACTPFYSDVDSDGYGTGAAVGFCGTTTPVGYAPRSGDCCDNATNLAVAKLIHPGADFQPTSAGGVCNITWDYNCSGAIEKNGQMGACAAGTTYPTCATSYTDFPDGDCGTMQVGAGCAFRTDGVCVTAAGLPTILGCR